MAFTSSAFGDANAELQGREAQWTAGRLLVYLFFFEQVLAGESFEDVLTLVSVSEAN
jgi:hypothetical protein